MHMFLSFSVVSSVDLQISPLRPSPSYSATESKSFRFSVKGFRLARGPEKFFSLGPNQVLAALLWKAKRGSVTPVALAGHQLQSLKRDFNVLMNSLTMKAVIISHKRQIQIENTKEKLK
jgi:hypothetical protein